MSSNESYNSDIKINWIGEVLNNKYVVLEKLGYGSYASVWLGLNYLTSEFYALKIHNTDDYECGLKESKLLTKLKSPYIINIIEYFDHKDFHVTVLELMSFSLMDLINKEFNKKFVTGLSAPFVNKIADIVFNGLQKIHDNNIIHSDIKPENILIKYKNYGTLSKLEKYNQLISKIISEDIIPSKHRIKNKKQINKVTNKTLTKSQLNKFIIKIKTFDSKIDTDSEPESDNISDISDEQSSQSSTDSITDLKDNKKENKPNKIRYRYKNKLLKINNTDKKEESKLIINYSDELINDMIKNCIIKISDLGTCYKIKKQNFEIQTRYYRAPEIILNVPYDKTCDYWSLGCTLYELFTGNILFDPYHTKYFSTDRHHIYLIYSKIGSIPEEIINKSPKKDIFYKNDLTLKYFNKYDSSSFINNLINNIDISGVDSKDIFILIKKMINLLSVNPASRKLSNEN
jgi:serine/threonine-protein kinase SRPK3